MPWVLKFIIGMVILFFGLIIWGLFLPNPTSDYPEWKHEDSYQSGSSWGNYSNGSEQADTARPQPSEPKIEPDRKMLEQTYTTPVEQEIEDMEWEDLKEYMAD